MGGRSQPWGLAAPVRAAGLGERQRGGERLQDWNRTGGGSGQVQREGSGQVWGAVWGGKLLGSELSCLLTPGQSSRGVGGWELRDKEASGGSRGGGGG